MNQTTSAYPSLSGNDILARLDSAEYQRLLYLFKVVDLESQQTLYAPGDEIRYVYFPVNCVVTKLTVMDDGATVETAMIGREGFAGFGTVVGSYRARYWTRVLLAGEALRAEAGVVREMFHESPRWRKLFLGYYSTLINQVSRRAVCNTQHRLNEQFCTWLLMVHDRAMRDEMMLTQEAVARQLGVRRAGINECVGWLQQTRAIEHTRGHLRILNREALEDAACVCYPAYRKEVQWLDYTLANNRVDDGVRLRT